MLARESKLPPPHTKLRRLGVTCGLGHFAHTYLCHVCVFSKHDFCSEKNTVNKEVNVCLYPNLIILGMSDLTEEIKPVWKPTSFFPGLTSAGASRMPYPDSFF